MLEAETDFLARRSLKQGRGMPLSGIILDHAKAMPIDSFQLTST
jgi:hypothetical protein